MPKTQMLINDIAGEECRIAVITDGKLEEFYQERASADSHVGNLYLGKVTNVEPSIQAAFVDFGLERNGFLHISDVHPMYFPGEDREEFEKVGVKTPRRERPPIQNCLRRGSKVVVQVLKEGIGTKGPTLTSYLSIPGRYLVMMPNMKHAGVSRKVEDDEARREMRQILKELNPPEDFGVIVRTAGIGQTKTEIKRDLSYLTRLWDSIEKRKKKLRAVGLLYAESDLIIRTIRDVYTTAIEEIIVDSHAAAQRVADFLAVINPRSKTKVFHDNNPIPLFHRQDIEPQIEAISAREVPLKSGGSLVFDQAEALVAIDVNSGKSRDAKDAESNAYNTNAEAIEEIARQLRLRDLGGVVILDLIDMMQLKNRRTIESRFKALMKDDRARTRVGSISQFGILEMTRQRMRPSLRRSLFEDCPSCQGIGQVRSKESVVLHVMRELAFVMHREHVARVELTISPDVAFLLLNRRRRQLTALEHTFNKDVTVRVGGASVDYINIAAFDERGTLINMATLTEQVRKASNAKSGLTQIVGKPSDPIEMDEEDEAPAPPSQQPKAASSDDAASGSYIDAVDDDSPEEGPKKKRRRRRRRRGKNEEGQIEGNEAVASDSTPQEPDAPEVSIEALAEEQSERTDESDEDGAPKKKRRRRRRSRTKSATSTDEQTDAPVTPEAEQPAAAVAQADAPPAEETGEDGAPKKKRRRRRRSRSKAASDEGQDSGDGSSSGYSNSVLATEEAS
ncbi:MAG: Rne/Rng family ribonuclease [Phycisphaeraceae bacterium]